MISTVFDSTHLKNRQIDRSSDFGTPMIKFPAVVDTISDPGSSRVTASLTAASAGVTTVLSDADAADAYEYSTWKVEPAAAPAGTST
jgi:hypothetical protein